MKTIEQAQQRAHEIAESLIETSGLKCSQCGQPRSRAQIRWGEERCLTCRTISDIVAQTGIALNRRARKGTRVVLKFEIINEEAPK